MQCVRGVAENTALASPLLLQDPGGGSNFVYYHKPVVAVNAPSARVTEGVPINNTLSLALASPLLLQDRVTLFIALAGPLLTRGEGSTSIPRRSACTRSSAGF